MRGPLIASKQHEVCAFLYITKTMRIDSKGCTFAQ